MRPRLDRIAFVGATTFAALAGLASLSNGSGDTPVVTQTQSRASVTTEPVAFTTPHPTAVFAAKPTVGSELPAPTATQPPAAEAPTPTPEPAGEPVTLIDDSAAELMAPTPTEVPVAIAECHPAYVECLPVTGDLNCADIGMQIHVRDVSNDPYNLDADNDGVGCESW